MQPFEGFHRRAVVVLPSDEVFKKRVKERTDDEGTDIPESAVNEMKAIYTLPEMGGCYESVEYTETDVTKEEPEKLIETYRKEGTDALPAREKHFRRESRDFEYRGRGRGRSSYRGNFHRGRGSGFRSRSRGRGRFSSRSRSRGYSSYRPPYTERRSRGYRGGFKQERGRDDRRDTYSYKPRGRGSSWGAISNWGSDSWNASSYREPRWRSYEDDYDQGWDDYDQGRGYDEWDGYGDAGYDQGWDAYGYN